MFRKLVLFMLLNVVVLSATAEAQPRRGFGGRGLPRGLNYLMAFSEIREHLSITDEQEKLFGGLILDQRAQQVTARRNPQSGPGPGRGEEIRKRMQKITQQFDELLGVMLEPKQTKRLHEIKLQYDGVRALDRPNFVKELQLSEEQQKQIQEIRGDPPRGRANAEQEAGILGLLTDEQKQNWDRMKGKIFVFPESLALQERQRGRRGGRRNRPRRP